MCGHFLRPACSMNVRVLIEMPMPQVAEHGENSDQGDVRQTPTPSPAASTLAAPNDSSASSSSSDL